MRRAPILITTLCRDKHFKQCVESLANNTLASETDLYIGLDYPLKDSHWEGYRKIKEYIQNGIGGFANVYCIEQEKNLGWYENFLTVREEIYKTYDSFIYTEDDNIFSSNFLEYMNICLDKYKDDERVYAVSGYCYPITDVKCSGDVFASKIYFSASGYGVWKKKENIMYSQITMDNFEKLLDNRKFVRNVRTMSKNQFCNFIRGMLQYKSELIKNKEVQKIDLSFGLQMFATDQAMIMPCKSLVKNCGYDGSGVNCGVVQYTNQGSYNHRNYDFANQPIDDKHKWNDLKEVTEDEAEYINQLIDDFFKVPFVEFIRAYICYVGIRVLGIKFIRKIINRLK